MSTVDGEMVGVYNSSEKRRQWLDFAFVSDEVVALQNGDCIVAVY